MKKLNSKGFKISSADHQALDHYLNVTPKKWSEDALAGMINKAIKTIMKDYLDIYKSKQTGNIPADISILIPAIISMPEFKPYNIPTPEHFDITKIKVKDSHVLRDQPRNIEIWESGFDVKDYEHQALNAYYEDPEAMLEWFMENKVHQRKNAMVKEAESQMLKDPSVTEIPSRQDAMINLITSKQNYKNRTQRDAEFLAQMQGQNVKSN